MLGKAIMEEVELEVGLEGRDFTEMKMGDGQDRVEENPL